MDTCEEDVNPSDAIRINRVKISLQKIERGMTGMPLAPSVRKCLEEKPREYEEKIEPYIYEPDNSHVMAMVPVIYDELSSVTKEIDLIVCDRAREFERDHYFKLKLLFCENIDAIAYQWTQTQRI